MLFIGNGIKLFGSDGSVSYICSSDVRRKEMKRKAMMEERAVLFAAGRSWPYEMSNLP